jgi:hypothetical protein
MQKVLTLVLLFFFLGLNGQHGDDSKHFQYFKNARYAISLDLGVGPLYAEGFTNQTVVYYQTTFYCNDLNLSGSFLPTTIDDSELLMLTFALGYQIHIGDLFTLNPKIGMSSLSIQGNEIDAKEQNNSGLNMGFTLSREFFKNPKHKLVLSLAGDYYNINFENNPVFTDNNLYQISGLIGYKFYFK